MGRVTSLDPEIRDFIEHCVNVGFTHVELESEEWDEFGYQSLIPAGSVSDNEQTRLLFTEYAKKVVFPVVLTHNNVLNDKLLFAYKIGRTVPIELIPSENYQKVTLEEPVCFVEKVGSVLWLQKGQPVKKHVVTVKTHPGFSYICLNGLPVFGVGGINNARNGRSKEPWTAKSVYKDGHFVRGDLISDPKHLLKWEEFETFLADDEKLIDYCFGEPVNFGDVWAYAKKDSFVRHSNYGSYKEAMNYALATGGVYTLKDACFNETVPEQVLLSYITKEEQLRDIVDTLLRRKNNSTGFLKTFLKQLEEKSTYHPLIDGVLLLNNRNLPLKETAGYLVRYRKDWTAVPYIGKMDTLLIQNHMDNLINYLDEIHDVNIDPTLVPSSVLLEYFWNTAETTSS